MKIVFLAPFGLRPKGTLLARMVPLAAELQRFGHRVTIIAPPYTNPEASGTVEEVAGVTVRNIALGPLLGAAGAPLLAWRMFRAALAERADLIHLFKPKGFGGLAAMLLSALTRLGMRLPPLFVDSDDWEGRGGMNALMPYSRMEKCLFQFQDDRLPPRAVGVTVASRTLQSRMWGLGIPPEQVLYLPNGVVERPRASGGAVREMLGIPASAPVLLLYTRFFEFSQEKLHFLFAEIYRQVPAVRFLVVGRGRLGEEDLLLTAAREHGFAPALILAGWVEPELLPGYLAAGDAAIYPFSDTLINRAKCSAKLTELIMAGVPVVADRVGQLAEYIAAGTSGVLCAPEDWQEMADAAAALLLDLDRRRSYAEEGRRFLLTRFAWPTLADRLNTFYREYVTP